MQLPAGPRNCIGWEGCCAIARALAHLPCLRVLDLSLNNIRRAGAEEIAHSLVHVPQLETLNLRSNKIGVLGAEALAMGLAAVPKLRHLYLWGNSIQDRGAEALACVLPKLAELRELDLSYNIIHGVGAVAIAHGLAKVCEIKCSRLETLNLSQNVIGGHHAEAMMKSMRGFTELKKLMLDMTAIGDQGAATLATFGGRGRSSFGELLASLELSSCNIGSTGADALERLLPRLPHLKVLKLRGTHFPKTRIVLRARELAERHGALVQRVLERLPKDVAEVIVEYIGQEMFVPQLVV